MQCALHLNFSRTFIYLLENARNPLTQVTQTLNWKPMARINFDPTFVSLRYRLWNASTHTRLSLSSPLHQSAERAKAFDRQPSGQNWYVIDLVNDWSFLSCPWRPRGAAGLWEAICCCSLHIVTVSADQIHDNTLAKVGIHNSLYHPAEFCSWLLLALIRTDFI